MIALAPHDRGAHEPGPWLPMRSGAPWDLLEPDPAMVDFADIAHGLARTNRFNGATVEGYSVAVHSLYVWPLVSPDAGPYALLHDAHEAMIGDWITPVKQALGALGAGRALERLEDVTAQAIHVAAGLEWPVPPAIATQVHDADMLALAAEKRDLMAPQRRQWAPLPEPPPVACQVLPAHVAERFWLAALERALGRKLRGRR